jgi:hypothetical protein
MKIHYVVSSKNEIIFACNVINADKTRFTTDPEFVTCGKCKKYLESGKVSCNNEQSVL